MGHGVLERVLIMVHFGGGCGLLLLGVLEIGQEISCSFEDAEWRAVYGDCLCKSKVVWLG